MMITPCFVTTLPGSVSSQLPPCSAAMSTMTLPGFIDCTMSAVMSFGAGLPGISAAEMMRCLDDGAIAANIGHRRQRIEFLRARDARHAVHRQHRRFLRRELLQQLRVLRGPDEAYENLTITHHLHFVLSRRADFEDDVGSGPYARGIGRHRRACRAIGIVADACRIA